MDKKNAANATDDQELAKVLENMNQQAAADTPAVPAVDPVAQDTATTDTSADTGLVYEEAPVATPDPVVEPTDEVPIVTTLDTPAASPELDSIKKTALEELRPLVDKLDLPAEEKFDTLLLIIRSTDDKSLVSAAHEAARGISDETKRAQALLDVIKEIDYFSGTGEQPA